MSVSFCAVICGAGGLPGQGWGSLSPRQRQADENELGPWGSGGHGGGGGAGIYSGNTEEN